MGGRIQKRKPGERTRKRKGKERQRERERESVCRGDAAEGVSWFGNSRGVAIGECGEMASGSLEATSGPGPGHNNSLSAAPALSGLRVPGNTQFTQAQNAACSARCLRVTVVFALCPQASRAIKKVFCRNRGLPFKGWSLEPSHETQMSRGRSVVSWERDSCH